MHSMPSRKERQSTFVSSITAHMMRVLFMACRSASSVSCRTHSRKLNPAGFLLTSGCYKVADDCGPHSYKDVIEKLFHIQCERPAAENLPGGSHASHERS